MSPHSILGDIFFEILYIYTKDLFGDNRYIIPKFFSWEIAIRFTILWEFPTTRKTFPHGKPPLFFTPPPYGKSPPLFFYQLPYGKFPKKIWKKIFLRDIWTTVPPKMGVPPGERGHGGIPTPPLWAIWGGDCLSRLLVRVLVRVLLVQCAFDFVHSCRQ